MRPFEDFANLFIFIFALEFAIFRLLRAGVLIVVGELVLDVVEVGLQVLTLPRFHLNTGFLSRVLTVRNRKRLRLGVFKLNNVNLECFYNSPVQGSW